MNIVKQRTNREVSMEEERITLPEIMTSALDNIFVESMLMLH